MAHFVLVPGMWLDARSWCQVTLPSSSWPQHPLADASQRSGNHTAGLGRRRCAKLETRMELNRASELRSSLRNSSCSVAGIEHDGLNVLGKAQPPMDMRFDIIVQYLPPNRRLSHFQRSPPGYAVSPPLLVPVSNTVAGPSLEHRAVPTVAHHRLHDQPSPDTANQDGNARSDSWLQYGQCHTGKYQSVVEISRTHSILNPQ